MKCFSSSLPSGYLDLRLYSLTQATASGSVCAASKRERLSVLLKRR